MRLSPRDLLATLLLLTCTGYTTSKEVKSYQCPLNFDLAYTTDKRPICFRLKDAPELFTEKFKDCAGNIFTAELYHDLMFDTTKHVLWTDFKSMYPGGPFVDSLFSGTTLNSFDVKYDSSLGIDEELCVVIDPVSNFTAVRCKDEKHYRYCFLKPYDDDDKSSKGCKGVGEYNRFYSPESVCLTAVKGSGRGLRPTWEQSVEICNKRGGTLLYKGWRLSNHPLLNNHLLARPGGYHIPMGMEMTPDGILKRTDSIDVSLVIPESEWHFDRLSWSSDASYGALINDTWRLVNSSFIFFHVICEKPAHIENIKLELTVDRNNLILTVNNTIKKNEIRCFTDSLQYFPLRVDIKRDDDDDDKFFVDTSSNGYYWCLQTNFKNYQSSKSNRILYVRRDEDKLPEESKVYNLYASKIRVSRNYDLRHLDSLLRVWKKVLKRYIYLQTLYIGENGNSENITEDMLLSFEKKKELEWKDSKVIDDLKIKRLYLDSRTVLLHLVLNPDMKQLLPGTKMNIIDTRTLGADIHPAPDTLEVVFMRPAYFCKGFQSLPNRELGATVTSGCSLFTCVGDFNEGVQWVETAIDGCSVPSTTELSPLKNKSEGLEAKFETDRVSTLIPPPSPSATKDGMPKTTYDNSTSDSSRPNNTGSSTESSVSGVHNSTASRSTAANNTDSDWSVNNSTAPMNTGSDWPVNNSTEPYNTASDSDDSSESQSSDSGWTDPENSTLSQSTDTDWNTISTVNPPTDTPDPTTTPRPPEEQLLDVIAELENLLENDTMPLPLESLEQPFDQVNDILNVEDKDFEISSDLLHLLDRLAERVYLGGEQRAVKVRDNVALMMADATPEHPIRGVRVAAPATGRSAEPFTNRTFDFIQGEINSTDLLSSESEAVVYLPASVTREPRRISFVAFRNQRAFQSEYTVNSRVFSVNVENLTSFERGEVIDIHLTPLVGTPARDQRRVCAYWQFAANGTGSWQRDGCRLIRATRPGAMDTCRCDHLTHFAEVLVPRTVFSEADERALEILSVVGLCVSLCGLLLVGVTAALFRSWRRDFSNKIWLQLCASIFLVGVCFLVVVYANFEFYDIPCMLVGVILHYSVVASFCWMLVAAVLSYRRLVLVFTRDMSHKLLRAAAFAWGAPCAVVGILLAVNPRAYADRFEELEPVRSFCYPTGLGLWLAVFAPIALILLANWTLFILIVRSVFASRRIQRHGDSNEALRCASVSCLLVFLFGLPWIIGLFASNVVMAYIFCLSANYQGFVLFVFFVVGNKKTRDLWLNKLKIKQTRKVPVTSSTYTNRSVGPGWRGGAEGASSIEAKTSKPRSLTSPDDSRFS